MEVWGHRDMENESGQTKYAKLRQKDFLETYAETGSVKEALKIADIARHTFNTWKRENLYGFKVSFDDANATIKDELQDIALSRVRNQQPRDPAALLIAMLRAFDPERYDRDNKTETDESKELMRKFTEWARENRRLKQGVPSSSNHVTEAQKILASGQKRPDDTGTQ